jgi:hypothetical protein
MKAQQLFTNAPVDQNYFQLFPTLFLSDKLNDQNTFNFQFGRRTDRPDDHELVPFRRTVSTTLYFQGNRASFYYCHTAGLACGCSIVQ